MQEWRRDGRRESRESRGDRMVPKVVVGGIGCVRQVCHRDELVVVGKPLHHQEVTWAADQVCRQLEKVGGKVDKDTQKK